MNLADPTHRRDEGYVSLAAAMLGQAVRDAALGLERNRAHHAHRWALIPRRSSDGAYRWLLESGFESAEFWTDLGGIDAGYFRQYAYREVESQRRKLAMKRIHVLGKLTEVIAGAT